MSNRERKPAWWQMFALVPLMLALLIGASQLNLPQWADEVVEIGIVLASFGGMLFWVHINTGPLEREAMEKDNAYDNLRVTIYDPGSRSDQDPDEMKQYEIARPARTVYMERLTDRKGNEKWQLN